MNDAPLYTLLMYGNVYPWGVLTFNKFLREVVEIPYQRIHLVHKFDEPEQAIIKFLSSLPRFQSTNVLVACDAHGDPGEFTLNGRNISYRRLASYFDIPGDLIFLNNACFSGSCIDAFLEAGLLPDKSMVITSSQHDEASYRYRLFDELIKYYSQRREYKPRRIGHLYRINKSTIEARKKVRIGHRAARLIGTDELMNEDYEDKRQQPVKIGKSLDHLLFAK